MTPSLDHPIHSFFSSELQQVVFLLAILHQMLFAGAEKNMHFLTQKSCQTPWKSARILFFLVAAGCQQPGPHLFSNPELRNPLQAGEQPLRPGGSSLGEHSPALNPGSAPESPRPPPAPWPGRMPLSLQRAHGVS